MRGQQATDKGHRTQQQVQKHKQTKCFGAERMREPMFTVPGDSIERSLPATLWSMCHGLHIISELRCRDLVNMPKVIKLVRAEDSKSGLV